MQKILGNLEKGLLFVLSAPAGAGKTTLVNMLKSEFVCIEQSISFTTREPRKGEIPGKDYYFISEEEFVSKIAQDNFLEYAKVFDYYYGTDKKLVQTQLENKKHVFLVIDTQGALEIKFKIPATYIFVLPPSLEVLLERMKKRDTDNDEVIQKRLSWAQKEIEKSKNYDYLILNEDLKTAYEVLRSVVIAEEHHLKNNKVKL